MLIWNKIDFVSIVLADGFFTFIVSRSIKHGGMVFVSCFFEETTFEGIHKSPSPNFGLTWRKLFFSPISFLLRETFETEKK